MTQAIHLFTDSISGRLEASLTQLGVILARDKKESKYLKIQENLKDLKTETKSLNSAIKDCCIEPGQRLESLHKNVLQSYSQRLVLLLHF